MTTLLHGQAARWLRVELTQESMHGEDIHEDDSALANASPLTLAATGMFFGLVHVLTGPDHLSALATLSAGSSWRSFALGIRWGCGHSIGLILMAIVFISLDGKLDFSVLNSVTDVLVGAFMIVLGMYGVFEGIKKSKKNARNRKHRHKEGTHQVSQHDSEDEAGDDVVVNEAKTLATTTTQISTSPIVLKTNSSSYDGEDDESSLLSPSKRRHRLDALQKKQPSGEMESREDSPVVECNSSDDANNIQTNKQKNGDVAMIEVVTDPSPTESVVALQELLSSRSATSDDDQSDLIESSQSSLIAKCYSRCPKVDFKNAQTQKCTALIVGIVHGIAGPGGILGVLPAVGLHDTFKACMYLGSFCFTSIAIMGIFAALYGEATGRLGERSELLAFRITIFSSMSSVIVGVIWLVLAALGKLQEVFG